MYTLSEIHEELMIDNKYSIDESSQLGTSLAKNDFSLSIKRILTYHGPFTTGCKKCLYYEIGYETYDFAPDDIINENVDAFVGAYNEVMKSLLSPEQAKRIDEFDYSSNYIFSSILTLENQYNVEKLNDTIVRFYFSSDTLEQIFKSDIAHIKIELSFYNNDSLLKVYDYSDIKTNGVLLYLPSVKIKTLFVSYIFKEMPNKYDICWCEILEKKYRLSIPFIYK